MDTIVRRIKGYKYADAKQRLWSIPIGHLLMAVVIVVFSPHFSFESRFFVNLFILISSIVAIKTLNWSNRSQVFLVLSIYYVVFFIEIIGLGIPSTAFPSNSISNRLYNEIMATIILIATPYVYILLRLVLGILLILPFKVVREKKTRKAVY